MHTKYHSVYANSLNAYVVRLTTLKICCVSWQLELNELYIEMYSCKKKLCLTNLKEHYALYVDNAN